MKFKKVRKWNVYVPVCYFEVFSVEAKTRKEAIKAVLEDDGTDPTIDQNCTVVNPKWSRRIWAVKCDKEGNEK